MSRAVNTRSTSSKITSDGCSMRASAKTAATCWSALPATMMRVVCGSFAHSHRHAVAFQHVATRVQVDHVAPQKAARRLVHDDVAVVEPGLGREQDTQARGPLHVAVLVTRRRLESQGQHPVAIDRGLLAAAHDG